VFDQEVLLSGSLYIAPGGNLEDLPARPAADRLLLAEEQIMIETDKLPEVIESLSARIITIRDSL
jgi:hypothetical protein